MFGADLLGFGEDMGDADLPVHSDTVIGGIAVAHQRSVKVLSEDRFCYFGRPVSVDMKEGKAFIACEPHMMAHTITPLGGFIGMDHIRGFDLLSQILIDWLPPYRRFAVKAHG